MTPRSRSSRFIYCAGVVIGGCVVLTAQTPARQERPGQMPVLPLTQLDERAPAADLDNRTFTLTFAQPVPVKDLLLLLLRGTTLSIVPDPAVAGTFIGELKSVTVRQALALILQPRGLDFTVDGNIVRVFDRERETRLYDINNPAVDRSMTTTTGRDRAGKSGAGITTVAKSDVFAELENGVRALVSDRATFNLDRKAGLLQVTDFPDRLQRIGAYLEATQDRLQRQVQIDARVVEVELSAAHAPTIDWDALAARAGGNAADRPTARSYSPARLRFGDLQSVMNALAEQGTVAVLDSPRLVTLNNEPAVVRSGHMSISVTPQIGVDAVMLSVSPILKSPVAETDMIARVADGETLVIQGFTTTSASSIRIAAGSTMQCGSFSGRSRSIRVTSKRTTILASRCFGRADSMWLPPSCASR